MEKNVFGGVGENKCKGDKYEFYFCWCDFVKCFILFEDNYM